MPKIRLLSVVSLALCALVFAACGSSLEESAADRFAGQAEQELKTRKPLPEPKPPVAEKVAPAAGEADINTEPKVAAGTGAPPTKLVVQDLIEGTGKAVKNGDLLSVQYVGVLFANGKQFDSSWGKDSKPLQFAIGTGNVIEGWDQGLLGMKVGGRRKLIVPADLAYGDQASGDIPANAALIFDIDLKKIG